MCFHTPRATQASILAKISSSFKNCFLKNDETCANCYLQNLHDLNQTCSELTHNLIKTHRKILIKVLIVYKKLKQKYFKVLLQFGNFDMFQFPLSHDSKISLLFVSSSKKLPLVQVTSNSVS